MWVRKSIAQASRSTKELLQTLTTRYKSEWNGKKEKMNQVNEEIRRIADLKDFTLIEKLQDFSNPNIERVVLQIGMDKTATTSIQLFLSENRPWLNRNSLEYRTDWGANNHSVPLKSMLSRDSQKIYWHVVSGHDAAWIAEFDYRNLLALCEGIKECKSKTYIFFGEGICGFKIHELKNLKKLLAVLMPRARVEILFCVRSVEQYASSGYQQAIRMGRAYDEKRMMLVYSNIYFRKLFRVLLIFGKRRLTVYPFEETTKHPYGPIGYFIQRLGASPNETEGLSSPKANESISFQATEIIDFINKRYPLIDGNKKSERRSKGDIEAIMKIEGVKYQLPEALLRKLKGYSLLDILWLRFFFKIKYPLGYAAEHRIRIFYGDAYKESFLKAYKDSNDFIKSCLYDFVEEKAAFSSPSEDQELWLQIKQGIDDLKGSLHEKDIL